MTCISRCTIHYTSYTYIVYILFNLSWIVVCSCDNDGGGDDDDDNDGDTLKLFK